MTNYKPELKKAIADKKIGTIVTYNNSTSAWLVWNGNRMRFKGGICDLLIFALSKGINIKHHVNNQPAAL